MFTVQNAMEQLAAFFYYGAQTALKDFQQYMGNMGLEVFDNSFSQALITFFLLMARSLLLVGVIVALFEYAIAAQSGSGDILSTGTNILKGVLATELFTVIPVKLYALTVNMQEVMAGILNWDGFTLDTEQAAQTSSPAVSLLDSIISVMQASIASKPLLSVVGFVQSAIPDGSAEQQHVPGLPELLFMLVLLFSFVKVLFDNMKRGAVLLVQISVCSLYMFSLPRGYTDGFYGWCRQVIALCFTSFLQNIFLIIGLMSFKAQIIVGLGIMLTAAEIPRIAQHYGLDTSMKANISSVTMATNSFMNIGRTIMKGAI